MECVVCRVGRAFPIGATGLAICPKCAEKIYQPLTELVAAFRAYGLMAPERGRGRPGRRVAEEAEAGEAEEAAQQAQTGEA